MIGKLIGIVDELYKDHFILNVTGVGYLIHCSTATLGKLTLGDNVSLIIETYVREDQISLYGFLTSIERQWFKKLTTIKGVGNKMALLILSVIPANNIGNIILSGDKKALSSVSGIGTKLSERIILELKNSDLITADYVESPSNTSAAGSGHSLHTDAISALGNLGYPRSEAYNIIRKILHENSEIDLSTLIKKALKELAS
jgi:Holliday junction DNA helicase RuvA